MSPGVDGAVKLEGEGESEGAGFGKRVGEPPGIFDGSIKRRSNYAIPKLNYVQFGEHTS